MSYSVISTTVRDRPDIEHLFVELYLLRAVDLVFYIAVDYQRVLVDPSGHAQADGNIEIIALRIVAYLGVYAVEIHLVFCISAAE